MHDQHQHWIASKLVFVGSTCRHSAAHPRTFPNPCVLDDMHFVFPGRETRGLIVNKKRSSHALESKLSNSFSCMYHIHRAFSPQSTPSLLLRAHAAVIKYVAVTPSRTKSRP